MNAVSEIISLRDCLPSRYAIICDTTVRELYGQKLHQNLTSKGLDVKLFSFPSGEQYKTRQTKESIENELFENGFGRDTCIIALGGGVVLDMAGFIATTFCRGVPLVMVPTTLLAMVDASIGGKTGVNTPYGKNLVGSFYEAKKIIQDTSFLQSLPNDEIQNGIVEMIKHGLIGDSKYFDFLETHVQKLINLDRDSIEKAICDSVQIKTTIVKADSNENGIRNILNFGHTVGHAIEKISDYRIPHGKAVAIGIVAESYLSMKKTHLPKNSYERIKNIFRSYEIPFNIPVDITLSALKDAMVSDKKSLKGTPRFVLISEIGKPLVFDNTYCTSVDIHEIEEMYHALHKY